MEDPDTSKFFDPEEKHRRVSEKIHTLTVLQSELQSLRPGNKVFADSQNPSFGLKAGSPVFFPVENLPEIKSSVALQLNQLKQSSVTKES